MFKGGGGTNEGVKADQVDRVKKNQIIDKTPAGGDQACGKQKSVCWVGEKKSWGGKRAGGMVGGKKATAPTAKKEKIVVRSGEKNGWIRI